MAQDSNEPAPTALQSIAPSQEPRIDAAGQIPTGGLNRTPATGGLPLNTGARTSVTLQNLSDDKLILSAPRSAFENTTVPSLGGIPLLAKLGQGGMGAVYFGFHLRLNKEVAVKVLPFHLAEQHGDAVPRFMREAQLAATVQSPHLVGVLDVNSENGLHYLVMEFVRGLSAQGYLKQCKANGRAGLPESVALELCIAAAEGLAVAHAEGIVHRDIKPDNILIPLSKHSAELNFSGAKVADLGLAHRGTRDQSITETGACMGTPGYMAPEQIEDAKSAGKPADVFSLGATLYALLAGSAPFSGGTLIKIFRATVDTPHIPVRTLRPEVSTCTAALIERALAKHPAARFEDAAALLAALKAARAQLAEPAETLRATPKMHTPLEIESTKPRSRALIGVLSLVVLAIGAPAGIWMVKSMLVPSISGGGVQAVREKDDEKATAKQEASTGPVSRRDIPAAEKKSSVVSHNQSREYKLNLSARYDWVRPTNAVVHVVAGEHVSVVAAGTWNWGGITGKWVDASGEGGHKNFRILDLDEQGRELASETLIARIGDGLPFVIGHQREFQASATGQLKFRMNEKGNLKGLNDNEGTLEITVAVKP